jgi:hypothetical protein
MKILVAGIVPAGDINSRGAGAASPLAPPDCTSEAALSFYHRFQRAGLQILARWKRCVFRKQKGQKRAKIAKRFFFCPFLPLFALFAS